MRGSLTRPCRSGLPSLAKSGALIGSDKLHEAVLCVLIGTQHAVTAVSQTPGCRQDKGVFNGDQPR